jgi:hypothetical protein
MSDRDELERRLMELAEDVRHHIDTQDPDGQHRIIADVQLVIGCRSFDDDNTCIGTVYTFGNETSMPGYVARGLLLDAADTIKEMP